MPATKHTFKSIIITQAIAIFGFILVPAAVTFVAPRTTVEMRHIGDESSARVIKHIWLAIPFRETTIAPVLRVESHVKAAEYGYSTHSDRLRGRKVEKAADGSIRIIGRDSQCQVQSTPNDAPIEAEQMNAFLEKPASEPLVMTLTAGWLFTYLLGGAMTALSLLYCVGAALAVGRWLLCHIRPATPTNTR